MQTGVQGGCGGAAAVAERAGACIRSQAAGEEGLPKTPGGGGPQLPAHGLQLPAHLRMLW